MTRKEVIDELQKVIDLIKQNGKDWLDERDIPILQMAITALELSDSIMLQLDCKMFHSGVNVESAISEATPSAQFAKDTNINDCISRQAAIDVLDKNLRTTDVPVSYPGIVSALTEWLNELPSAQPEYDCVLKQFGDCSYDKTGCSDCEIKAKIRTALSAQPKPLSNAYTKTVWTWLLDYQIKAAELKGRYTPYEVLSWVANDWRKEHEGSD